MPTKINNRPRPYLPMNSWANDRWRMAGGALVAILWIAGVIYCIIHRG